MERDVDLVNQRIGNLEKIFRKGLLPVRYQRHLDSVKKYLEDIRNIIAQAESSEISSEAIKQLDEMLRASFMLSDMIEAKVGSEHKRIETVLEAVGLEFYRLINTSEIHGSLVYVSPDLRNDCKVVHPISLKDGNEPEPDRLPFIIVSPDIALDSGKWLAMLHEFSHVVYDDLAAMTSSRSEIDSHRFEFFSDILPADIVGIGYVVALRNASGNYVRDANLTHPSVYSRIAATAERVKLLCHSTTTFDFVTLCNKIWSDFDTQYRGNRDLDSSIVTEAVSRAESLYDERHLKKFDENDLLTSVDECLGKADFDTRTPIVAISALSVAKASGQTIEHELEDNLSVAIERWLVNQL